VSALRAAAPGILTTLQDFGRHGRQRLGIPAGGALDPLSLRAANLLAGNPPDAGALEIVAQGPTLVVQASSVRIGLAGARAPIAIIRAAHERRIEAAVGMSVTLKRGDVIRIGRVVGASVLYLAVEGGFAVEPTMDSQSTYLRGGFGGFAGRALQAGDLLPLARNEASPRAELCLDLAPFALRTSLRAIEGPQSDFFADEERAAFFGRTYRISPQWSRMGLRLDGEPVRHARGADIASDGVVQGSIQVPGDGQPIVLSAERQTTGGYPKIAAVISADLPALGRLGPGASVRFERVTLDEAEAAARIHAAFVERLPTLLAPLPPADVGDLPARLAAANLVSGVIDARG